MKKINKKTEKKQRVRILETGELGTVMDQQLMPRDGQLHRYMQVLLDKQPHLDRWFWDDQLGGTKETCRMTIEGESGQTLVYDLTMDYEKNRDITMTITGRNPNNLMEHRGLHMLMSSHLLEGFTAQEVEVE